MFTHSASNRLEAVERDGSAWPTALKIGAGALAATLVVVAGVGYGLYASWKGSDVLAHGLMIHDQDVGGLTSHQARAKLQKRFANTSLQLRAPGQAFNLSVRELGGSLSTARTVEAARRYGRSGGELANAWRFWQARREAHRLPLVVTWHKPALRAAMRRVAAQYRVPARDARLAFAGDELMALPEVMGRELNVGATLQTLQKRYYLGLPALTATTREVAPRYTSADLSGDNVMMGTFSTRFDPGLIGRTKNIRIAAATFDRQILAPGEEFSFNRATGERTWDKGYRMAHIFVRERGEEKAKVVDGLAGGICQVSTTLYNAVRESNEKRDDQSIKVTQRESHSLPVSYISPGYDATVAWPLKDFKFRNTLAHPIFLRANVDGPRLTISVWGRIPTRLAKN